MKFRRDTDAASGTTREEVREMAEALSLYRSAMRHIAEKEAARSRIVEPRPGQTIRFGMLLAPALTAAVAAAVLVPVYSHIHHHTSAPNVAVKTSPPSPVDARANVDDTVLMNQIDSDLSEDVPDALRPLADLSSQTTNASAVSEKKNVTQE
ncbi:MAG: hypothetical protein WCC27_22235 [Acidobacteriaceae bacterium]